MSRKSNIEKSRRWRKGPKNAAMRAIAAPVTGFAAPMGGEMDGLPGVILRLVYGGGPNGGTGWHVLTINWDNLPEDWRPGMPVPFGRTPLAQWLNELEDELGLSKTFMTSV